MSMKWSLEELKELKESEEVLNRKRLEWELSLSSSDIRSNGWFHGSIQRSYAEELLKSEGDFVVRDCSTRNGDYVLSSLNFGHYLHFVISKVILQPNTVYERIQYTFEDECFDTITDLITYYVGNKRPISLASNAVITTPVNRTIPLTYTQINQKKSNNLINNNNKSDINIEQKIENNLSEDELSGFPPPKPSRIPVSKYININNESRHESSEDNHLMEKSGQESNQNGSHGSEGSVKSVSPKQIAINDNYSNKSGNNKSGNKLSQISKTIEFKELLTNPPQISSSFIRPHNFQTYLLPKDNKPLESSAIIKINSVLCDTGARILANHLTKCDLEFIKHTENKYDFGLGIESALELMLLPQGQQMRSDILERHQCLKYFVAISLLTTISDRNRAIVLNKWIEIAIETKTGLGDLFGFASIMEALSMSPILKLKTMWDLVRKDYTQNAIIYETKLRPQLKHMTEANEPQAPNTTFPFVLTLVQILERHENMSKNQNQIKSLNFGFEQTAVDYGLQQIYSHLEEAPKMIDQLSNYRRNGYIVLDGFQYEQLLYDMFRTEFHRQFLFGFRGSIIDSNERFDKLDQIVMAFMRKCQTDID